MGTKRKIPRCRFRNEWWPRHIRAAKARGSFTPEDCSKAGNWVTCACGKLDGWIETEANKNEPKDYMLYRLGNQFYDHVKGNEFDSALATLKSIQARALELMPKGWREAAKAR